MSGDSARKVVAMGLNRGFVRIQLGRLVKKVALLCARKEEDAKTGTTIVNHCQVLRLLNEIYLCILSDFILQHATTKVSFLLFS